MQNRLEQTEQKIFSFSTIKIISLNKQLILRRALERRRLKTII